MITYKIYFCGIQNLLEVTEVYHVLMINRIIESCKRPYKLP